MYLASIDSMYACEFSVPACTLTPFCVGSLLVSKLRTLPRADAAACLSPMLLLFFDRLLIVLLLLPKFRPLAVSC